MLFGFGAIIFGVLLTIWGFYNIKQVRSHKKSFNILDILINGWGSGLGMFLLGIACIIIGIVSFFMK